MVFVIFDKSCFRILVHSACHTGVGAFGFIAVPAENGCRSRLGINYDSVSCVSALCLMAYHAGSDAGKTSDAFITIDFYSIHSSALLRDLFEPAGSAFVVRLPGILVIARRRELVAFNIMNRRKEFTVLNIIAYLDGKDSILSIG